MGLFGKKKSEGEDSADLEPEVLDAAAAVPKPRPPPPPERGSEAAPKGEPRSEGVAPPKVAPPRAPTPTNPPGASLSSPPPPPPPVATGEHPQASPVTFGIDDAVQLVRQLPTRNPELVMQVVKKTLESVRVDVSQIIDGATKKENRIEERIGSLRREIDQLEAQVAANRKEILALEAEEKEVSGVKERLLQAQKLEASEPGAPRPTRSPGADELARAPTLPGPAMSSPPAPAGAARTPSADGPTKG